MIISGLLLNSKKGITILNKVSQEQIIDFLIQKIDERAEAIGEDDIENYFGEAPYPQLVQDLIKRLSNKKLYISYADFDRLDAEVMSDPK